MANRIPLIVNSNENQIQELPVGDSLNGIANITATGTITANVFVGNGTIPLGGIIMWSGSVAAITSLSGWELCDGNSGNPINGIAIPDLRNRFVVGAYSDGANPDWPNLAPNDTGGSENAVLIAHTHTQTQSGTNDDAQAGHVPSGGPQSGSDLTNISTVGIDADGNSSTTQTGNDANLPPYYALAFIIRTL